MIIVKLQGGLGNQMFQYAFGRKLALDRNTEFKLDISLFENYPYHAYSLSPFNILENFAAKEEIERFRKYKTRDGKRWFLFNLLFKNARKYVRHSQFNFDQTALKADRDAYLDGYWQTEKYFKEIEGILRKEFTLKKPLSPESQVIMKDIKSVNAISLHVRHGVYLTNKKFNDVHGVCSLDYYNKAIKYMATHVENPHFFVFSDDQKWSQANIKPDFPVTFVNHTSPSTDYEDLILMSSCKHHILANSTFSWWGAWLNPSIEKVVIGPEKWFNKQKSDTSDLFPKGWLRI